MIIGYIIKKSAIYIAKKTIEGIVKDKNFLENLKRYKPGNINIYNIVKYGSDAVLILV